MVFDLCTVHGVHNDYIRVIERGKEGVRKGARKGSASGPYDPALSTAKGHVLLQGSCSFVILVLSRNFRTNFPVVLGFGVKTSANKAWAFHWAVSTRQ